LANFGKETDGTHDDDINDHPRGFYATAGDGDGTADSMTLLCSAPANALTKLGLFLASDLSFHGGTEEKTINQSLTWTTFNFNAPKPSITNGVSYLLVAWSDASVIVRRQTIGVGTGEDVNKVYGSWWTPFGGWDYTKQLSLYCTYTPTPAPSVDGGVSSSLIIASGLFAWMKKEEEKRVKKIAMLEVIAQQIGMKTMKYMKEVQEAIDQVES